MKEHIGLILKGMAMGMAEVVPGVSGGTIAFITGIYERLIRAVRGINLSLMDTFKHKGLQATLTQMDFFFLLKLGIGMIVGIVGGLFGLHYLIEQAPTAVWAFFFGLILASVILLFRQIEEQSFRAVLLIIAGAAIAVIFSVMLPLNGNLSLIYVFISGFLAISALMLPGISGSFILLLLGMYLPITGAVKDFISTRDLSLLPIIGVFALGCIGGLVVLSRVLMYYFENYRDGTFAILTGFVLGSLLKIWPWQNPLLLIDKSTGEKVLYDNQNLASDGYEIVAQKWVWPSGYFENPMLQESLICMALGFMLIGYIAITEEKKNQKKNSHEPEDS